MTKFKLFLVCPKCGKLVEKIVNYYREAPPTQEERDQHICVCPECGKVESDNTPFRQVFSTSEYDQEFETKTLEWFINTHKGRYNMH